MRKFYLSLYIKNIKNITFKNNKKTHVLHNTLDCTILSLFFCEICGNKKYYYYMAFSILLLLQRRRICSHNYFTHIVYIAQKYAITLKQRKIKMWTNFVPFIHPMPEFRHCRMKGGNKKYTILKTMLNMTFSKKADLIIPRRSLCFLLGGGGDSSSPKKSGIKIVTITTKWCQKWSKHG